MAIKTFTVSALTSGVLVLAYAAWSKWRPAKRLEPQSSASSLPEPLAQSEPQPEPLAQSGLEVEPKPLSEAAAKSPASEADAIDVVLDDLWTVDDVSPNPNEQLVDFASEDLYDDDEGSVAPEGLGVRWLTRATEAMSPFHHALTVRDEAEAALLEGVTQNADTQADAAPESSQRLIEGDFDVEFPAEKRGG